LQVAKMRRKADLPQKPCLACGRPFAWRRKWRNVWDAVKFCSDRCRDARLPSRLVADTAANDRTR
jgi:hypothetical protein